MHTIVPEGQHGTAYIDHIEENGVKLCRLRSGGTTFMNDTSFEHVTNAELVRHAHGRVLIAGLGIGMVLWPIAAKHDVTEIVVIEKSPDVIALVGDHVPRGKVRIIAADINEWRPEPEERFNVVWFDHDCTYTVAKLRAELRGVFRAFLPYLVDKAVDPDRWMYSWQRTALRELRRQTTAG